MTKPAEAVVTVFAALVLASLGACGEAEQAAETASGAIDAAKKASKSVTDRFDFDRDKVQELAELAAAIEKDPSRAEELLKEKGLTREEFEKAVQRLESNPTLSRLYKEFKEAAGS